MDNFDDVDSCVVLETIFEEERCKLYVNTIGYKLRNKGMITIPLAGEIFSNLFLKISQNIDDAVMRKVVIQNAVDFFDDTMMTLLQKGRLIIAKINDGDYQYIPRIKELDYKITDDDALHISTAINKKCQRFITIDKDLLNDRFRGMIKSEFGLVIAEP